jgi:hypothetical protein
VRIFIWAYNPAWDDAPPPIAIEKKYGVKPNDTVKYFVGWKLDGVIADDMHALIIGIDEYMDETITSLKQAVADATRVSDYLRNNLQVPEDQITTLTDKKATEQNITDALVSLARNSSIRRDAPIVIYIASHTSPIQKAQSSDSQASSGSIRGVIGESGQSHRDGNNLPVGGSLC